MSLLVVDHFHGFVARPSSKTPGRCQQMRPLPDSAGAQTVFLVITVAHRNDSHQGCSQHQLGISIFLPSGCNPPQHPQRHHLENCSGDGGLPEGIKRESIAKSLNVSPMGPNPSAAATFNLGIGIDYIVGSRSYFHDPLSVGLAWEEKKLDLLLIAGHTA